MATTDSVSEFADLIIEAIAGGDLDGHLNRIDDSLSDRIAKHNDEKLAAEERRTKKGTTSATEKVVPQPKREKSAGVGVVDVEVGATYIVEGLKNLAGKKVKFLRFRKQDDVVDKNKAVVEMLEDAPGAPKTKKVVVPTAALKKPVGRRPGKKVAAKKSAPAPAPAPTKKVTAKKTTPVKKTAIKKTTKK